jgi:hypothetical protein
MQAQLAGRRMAVTRAPDDRLHPEGGPLMWPILVCSIIAIAVFAERLLYFHRASIHVPNFSKASRI